MGLGGYDMLGGAKLHGQSGRVSFGAMDVMTGKDFGDPRFNYSAVRLKGDILRSSTIGLLAVSKDSLGAGLENENGAVGADFAWQMNRDTRLVTQYARSTRAGTGGEGYAAASSFSYAGSVFDPRDNMSVSASFEDITPDFDIRDIGYIGGTRLDRRGGRGSLGYDYWIKSDRLNRASASAAGWSYRDHGGHIRTQDGFSGQVSFETRNLVKPGFPSSGAMSSSPVRGRATTTLSGHSPSSSARTRGFSAFSPRGTATTTATPSGTSPPVSR